MQKVNKGFDAFASRSLKKTQMSNEICFQWLKRLKQRHVSSIGYELDAPYQAQAQFPLPSAILDGVTSVPEAEIAPAPVMEHQARSPCPGYPVSDVGSHH